jgi:signal transduction histidine kinase
MTVQRQMRDMVVANYLQSRAPILLLDLDEQGLVLEANQYARRLLGNDCVGRSISQLVLDFHNRFDLTKLRTMHHGELLSFITAAGAPVSLKVSFLPLGDAGILIGEHDQQETEELQTTLIRLNSDLNTISRDLQKKTAQLQQTNNLKNQFLGIAAHDLRNPLATIYSYIELLKEDLDAVQDITLVQPLQDIHEEVEYMLNLVSNLLDYSVIEQGHLELDLQEIELRQLLMQVVQLNSLLAKNRNITIRLEIRDDPGWIPIDLHRMRQVLNNLISNGIKYSPPDTTVLVTLTIEEQNLTVSVQDQGPGIPPNELNRLFTPFGKTSQRAASGDKSTGLGLAICRKMIESHKGRIWVENLPEGGACFRFTLPVKGTD